MTRIESILGQPPSRALGDAGDGLLGSVEQLHTEIGAVRSEMTRASHRLDGLEASNGMLRRDVDRVLSRLDDVAAALGELKDTVRAQTDETRRQGPMVKRPDQRKRAATIAGIAVLITAISSGVATVVSASRADKRSEEREERTP
jgi:hypothetical protein